MAQYNPTTITSDLLKPTVPMNLPPTTPDTSASALAGSLFTENQNAIDKQVADSTKANESSTKDIASLIEKIGGVQAKQGQYENDAGATGLKEKVDSYQNAIDIEAKALKDYTDNLYTNPNLTQGLAGKMATEAQRKSASYTSDLAITQNVLAKNYDRAIEIARKKVDMELAPLKTQLEAKKYVYEQNKDIFTAGEKAKLDNIIKMDERKYNSEKETKDYINETAITARKNGADEATVKKILESKTKQEAVTNIGSFAVDPLDRKVKQATLDKIYSDMSVNKQELALKIKEFQLKASPTGASDVKKSALDSAYTLLGKIQSNNGFQGAVGSSFQKFIPKFLKGGNELVQGTPASDFKNTYDNLKALLSLDNIKLLKGQGAISDGERKTLEDASSKLNTTTSEEEFKKVLNTTITALGGDPNGPPVSSLDNSTLINSMTSASKTDNTNFFQVKTN